jgi:hypothetical protein
LLFFVRAKASNETSKCDFDGVRDFVVVDEVEGVGAGVVVVLALCKETEVVGVAIDPFFAVIIESSEFEMTIFQGGTGFGT